MPHQYKQYLLYKPKKQATAVQDPDPLQEATKATNVLCKEWCVGKCKDPECVHDHKIPRALAVYFVNLGKKMCIPHFCGTCSNEKCSIPHKVSKDNINELLELMISGNYPTQKMVGECKHGSTCKYFKLGTCGYEHTSQNSNGDAHEIKAVNETSEPSVPLNKNHVSLIFKDPEPEVHSQKMMNEVSMLQKLREEHKQMLAMHEAEYTARLAIQKQEHEDILSRCEEEYKERIAILEKEHTDRLANSEKKHTDTIDVSMTENHAETIAKILVDDKLLCSNVIQAMTDINGSAHSKENHVASNMMEDDELFTAHSDESQTAAISKMLLDNELLFSQVIQAMNDSHETIHEETLVSMFSTIPREHLIYIGPFAL